jgi:hypothetical protein
MLSLLGVVDILPSGWQAETTSKAADEIHQCCMTICSIVNSFPFPLAPYCRSGLS